MSVPRACLCCNSLHYRRNSSRQPALCRPGGQLHPQDFIDNHGDVVVQLVLALIVFYLLVQGKKQPRGPRQEAPLTEKVYIPLLC